MPVPTLLSGPWAQGGGRIGNPANYVFQICVALTYPLGVCRRGCVLAWLGVASFLVVPPLGLEIG